MFNGNNSNSNNSDSGTKKYLEALETEKTTITSTTKTLGIISIKANDSSDARREALEVAKASAFGPAVQLDETSRDPPTKPTDFERIINSNNRSTLLIGFPEGEQRGERREKPKVAEGKLNGGGGSSETLEGGRVKLAKSYNKCLDVRKLTARPETSDTIESGINCNNNNNNNQESSLTRASKSNLVQSRQTDFAETGRSSNKMVDSKRKSIPNKNPSATTASTTIPTPSSMDSNEISAGESNNLYKSAAANNQNAPSYSSIYAQQQIQIRRTITQSPDRTQMNSTNSNNNSSNVNGNSTNQTRPSIRRQEAASVTSQPPQVLESSLDSPTPKRNSNSARQYSSYSYAESKQIDSLIDDGVDDEEDLDEDDEEGDPEMEDKSSYSAQNNNSNKHRTPILDKGSNSQQQQLISKSHSQQKLQSSKQPNRISPNKHQQQNRKSNWLDHNVYLQQQQQNQRTSSKDSHKIAMIEGPYRYPAELYHTKHARTRTCMLVLKFLVLLLLTLLLLMLLTGMIMAGRYLPKVIEEVMAAPRTFNVTISG